jgi:hypothetical protein
MKKQYILIILMVTAKTLAFGQSANDGKRWNFGVMAGSNFTTYVPKTEGFDAVPGFLAGADIGYNLQNSPKGWSLHLQPYFMATRSSAETGIEGTESYSETKSKTKSVNVPLLVRYTITGGKIRPFAEIGAVWSAWNRWSFKSRNFFCLNGECHDLVGDWTHGNVDDHRFSALASAGVQVNIGKVTIPITVRVLQLLKKKETFYDPFSGKNHTIPTIRSFQVTAGLEF